MDVTYNSILDDDEEREEEDTYDGYERSVATKDSAVDSLLETGDDTQFSSLICEKDNFAPSTSNFKNKSRVRRVVKKKSVSKSCLSVEVLPDSFRSAFSFEYFNRMQSEAFPSLYESDENCVVSSPTGSGKTVLFELAIMRLIRNLNHATANVKILYIAPTKSLCCEKFKSWSPALLNLTVGMLTSDTTSLETEKVKKCNIIITTPEKWDLLTRKWKDYSRMFELIKLVLVDEVHFLRERRGATLEVILTRMNMFCENLRIIAVSATIPNVEDVAEWLKSRSSGNPAKVLAFDDTYRQVSLEKWVYGLSFNNKNEFQHDSLYNSKLPDILHRHSKQRSVLIFCPTRASAISTAKYVAQNCPSVLQCETLGGPRQLNDQSLTDCFLHGVAFHHAGLSMRDRQSVEQGFLNGTIKVLCSTSTLAVGVNLPAYLVIIKGTRMWNASALQEYTQLDILQMIGRAGRPPFEKDGCAVILTDSLMQTSYENLIHGADRLESCLHLELIEHLAAEISLSTVFSNESAVTWLQNTFFYVRFKKNPSAYSEVNKLVKDRLEQDSQIAQFSSDLLNVLMDSGMIEQRDGSLVSTPFGHAMTRHYVLFETMKLFLKTKSGRSVENILQELSNATELADIRLRQKEKRLYREINASPHLRYPYPSQGKKGQTIDAPNQKVSLILQYELGGLEFPSYNGASTLHQSMAQDKMLVFRHCIRLLQCIVDISVEKKDGISLKNTLSLLRSMNGNCWEDSAMVLRQLKDIGLASVCKLDQRGIHSLQQFILLSDQQMESYLGLKMGAASKLRRDVELLPCLNLNCKMEDAKVDDSQIHLTFNVEINATYKSTVWHGQNLSVDLEVSKVTGELLDFRRIPLKHLTSSYSFRVTALVRSKHDTIEFTINCLEVAGLGDKKTITADTLLPSHLRAHLIDGNTNASPCSRIDGWEDQSMDDSPSSDDSIFRYLEDISERTLRKRESVAEDPVTNRKVRSNGNLECYHACKDKSKCRHLCCKEGIPKDCLRNKKSAEIKYHDLPPDLKERDHRVTSSGPENTFSSRAAKGTEDHPINAGDLTDVPPTAKQNHTSFDRVDVLMPQAAPSPINLGSSPQIATNSQEELQEFDLDFLGSDVELR